MGGKGKGKRAKKAPKAADSIHRMQAGTSFTDFDTGAMGGSLAKDMQAAFPALDPDVIELVLVEHGGDLDQAVDHLQKMSEAVAAVDTGAVEPSGAMTGGMNGADSSLEADVEKPLIDDEEALALAIAASLDICSSAAQPEGGGRPASGYTPDSGSWDSSSWEAWAAPPNLQPSLAAVNEAGTPVPADLSNGLLQKGPSTSTDFVPFDISAGVRAMDAVLGRGWERLPTENGGIEAGSSMLVQRSQKDEQEFEVLLSMFPALGREVIWKFYVTAGRNVSSAIETLLAHSTASEVDTASSEARVRQDSVVENVPALARNRREDQASTLGSGLTSPSSLEDPLSAECPESVDDFIESLSMTAPSGKWATDLSMGSPNAADLARRPTSQGLNQTKSTKLKFPSEALSESQETRNLSTPGDKTALEDKDVEGFLLGMLGDDFEISRDTVRAVLETFEGDFIKSLDTLLNMTSPSSGPEPSESEAERSADSKYTEEHHHHKRQEEELQELAGMFPSMTPATCKQMLEACKWDFDIAVDMLLEIVAEDSDTSKLPPPDSTTPRGSSWGASFSIPPPPPPVPLPGAAEFPPLPAQGLSGLEGLSPRTKANLDKLALNFPSIERGSLLEILRACNCNFSEAVKFIRNSVPPPSATPKHAPPRPAWLGTATGRAEGRGGGGGPTWPSLQEQGSFRGSQLVLQEPEEEGRQDLALERRRAAARAGPHNHLYSKRRRTANQYYTLMKYYFQEAQAAFLRGEKSRAVALSEQGRKCRALGQEEGQKAARKIFSEQNRNIENTYKVDMHGLHVEEALRQLELYISRFEDFSGVTNLEIITGRGLHSLGGEARILPAVKRFLEEEGLPYVQKNAGCLMVRLEGGARVRRRGADLFDDSP